MKTPLLLPLACLIATVAHAAVPPANFAGVPWGASPDEARRIMAERGAQFDAKQSKGKVQVFLGGKFAEENAQRFELKFDGGFYDGIVQLGGGEKAETLYRRMITEISGKYGSANEKEVAHRLPPHFVLGLGWRSSGSKKPPQHAEWMVESALNGGSTVVISTWAHAGKVHVQYLRHANPAGGTLVPINKSRPANDL